MALCRLVAQTVASMARHLVIQPAFLGDAVLALPLIGRLKTLFPSAEVHALVRTDVAPLLEGHPWISRLWTWDKTWRGWLTLLHQLRPHHWEGVWVVQRFFRSGLLGRLLPASLYVTYDKNPLSWLYTRRAPHRIGDGTHEVDRVLALAAAAGLTPERPPLPWLFPPETARQKVARWIERQPYLILAPTSRWPTKEAPFRLWEAFLHNVPPSYTIYLTGLPSDRPRLEPLARAHPAAHNLGGALTLPELAALVQSATRVYTVDSALTHIASALGRPTTTVFCSTVPAFGFGPLAPHSTLVETPRPLSCRPCGLHGKTACPLGHFACGHSLPLQDLIAPLLTEAPPPAAHTAADPPPPT